MSKPTPGIPELVAVVAALSKKIDAMVRVAKMPHIPPATLATALMLTGVKSQSRIAEMLGVTRQTLHYGESFAAYRLASGAINGRVASRMRRGDEDTGEGDDD